MKYQVKTVRGAQADGAASLGLVKITEGSARDLFTMGVPLVLAPAKASPWHFFKGWNLAMPVSAEPGEATVEAFDKLRNRFNAYATSELGNAVWFVDKKYVGGPKRSSRRR